jgi:hypothetical protein
VELTKNELDELLKLYKYYEGKEVFDYPSLGGNLSIPLSSRPPKEEFILDITRGRINLRKNTFQNRVRVTIVLVRLDIDGAPHRNPDGEELPGTHLHIYCPGVGDKWAISLPSDFTNTADNILTLEQFMDYCSVVEKPIIQRGLFS